MTRILSTAALLVLLMTAILSLHLLMTAWYPERILGKADAPITVEEYVSMTCPHCAVFYNKTLPQLEKDYVDTGKVRFILRDFPLMDNVGLKASAIARCMPAPMNIILLSKSFIRTRPIGQRCQRSGKIPDPICAPRVV